MEMEIVTGRQSAQQFHECLTANLQWTHVAVNDNNNNCTGHEAHTFGTRLKNMISVPAFRVLFRSYDRKEDICKHKCNAINVYGLGLNLLVKCRVLGIIQEKEILQLISILGICSYSNCHLKRNVSFAQSIKDPKMSALDLIVRKDILKQEKQTLC